MINALVNSIETMKWEVMRMNKLTLYEDLRNEKFRLDNKKISLIKERDNLNAKIDELQQIIDDLDVILCQHGKQVLSNYLENKELETKEQ